MRGLLRADDVPLLGSGGCLAVGANVGVPDGGGYLGIARVVAVGDVETHDDGQLLGIAGYLVAVGVGPPATCMVWVSTRRWSLAE